MQIDETKHRVTSRADGFGNRDCSCGGVWNDGDATCSTLKQPEQPDDSTLVMLANRLTEFSWKEVDEDGEVYSRSLIGEMRWNDHSLNDPDARFFELASFVLKAICSPKRESGWLLYPEHTPKMYGSVPVSHLLLFATHDELNGTFIRLGYYCEQNACFFESGDKKSLPWDHTVKKFLHFPLPEIEGGES